MKKLILICMVFLQVFAGSSQNIPYPVIPDWESAPNGHIATGLGLADINGDGWKDMIVANGNDIQRQHLVVYYNQGDGNFGLNPDWQSADIDYHGHLSVGDLDKDGWMDVAVSVYIGPTGFNSPGKLKIYFNNEGVLEDTPSFESYDFYTFSCAMGDADADGDLDIATTGGEPYNNILDYGKIFYNNDGNFSNQPEWSSAFIFGSMDVDFGDLDRNGKLDLAFATESSPNYLFIADDEGVISNTPAWHSTGTINYMNSLDIGIIGDEFVMGMIMTGNNQLGGDGRVKLYTFENGIPQESDASWISNAPGYWSGVLLHDVDLDGINDLIYGGWWLPINIHLGNNESFHYTPDFISLTSSVVEAILIADLNKDGMKESMESFAVTTQGKSIFYLNHPIEFVSGVIISDFGIGPEYYCYIPGKNWVSIDKEIVAEGDTVFIMYEYSQKGDIAITNWDSGKGNYIFYSDTTITHTTGYLANSFEFNLYPNPANQFVTIRLYQPSGGDFDIFIRDLRGKLLKQIAYPTNTIEDQPLHININDLTKGMYMIQLKNNTFSATKKLIIN
ncbi:MAG: hypothetical protein C0591_05515 [Marinilabiliales bacterium]|nr:MAG: hypothetical protein C0591_05515 [Marinilabiliales bacterium]